MNLAVSQIQFFLHISLNIDIICYINIWRCGMNSNEKEQLSTERPDPNFSYKGGENKGGSPPPTADKKNTGRTRSD